MKGYKFGLFNFWITILFTLTHCRYSLAAE